MTSYRYFEDFRPGERIPLGEKAVTREEIVAFAREFDPQPFHLDEAAAEASLLGGLAASGWHTAAMYMRLLVDGLLGSSAGQGAPGIDRLVWRRPVRPGDVLSAEAEVVSARPLRSRPGLGIVSFRFTVTNQHGDTVMTVENPILFSCRSQPA
ncbi:MaoC family dehydratase [Polymorphum gilvum]|uniref:MaoC-like dehydratase, putative n=1 Tax=Polymorphum gilvum (strain LMG 25793 / CGMCC 1.9160 / SL003B-26A1) TaxID=991905 RepID=F2IZQ2_POLGS|nr:MaoC family dehydratase [Polymorphum gilvum]ADZ69608.1 MaoC-like dehydratase, putative [Polymorphum gilvum SL003B-26A1]